MTWVGLYICTISVYPEERLLKTHKQSKATINFVASYQELPKKSVLVGGLARERRLKYMCQFYV